MEVVGGRRPFSKGPRCRLGPVCCDGREQECFPSSPGAAAPCAHTGHDVSFRSESSWLSLSGINQLPRLPWGLPFPCLKYAGCHPTSVTLPLPMASYLCPQSFCIPSRDLVLIWGTADLISLPNKPCFPLSQQHVTAPWLCLCLV